MKCFDLRDFFRLINSSLRTKLGINFIKSIGGLIESNLQKNWNLKRIPVVLLSILRVAVTEMIVSKHTSIGIIVSEYIMFTESFYTDNEYLFTNAILEKIYLNLKKKNTLNE